MMQWIGGTHGRFLSSPLNGRPEQAKLVKTIHLKQWCPDKNIHNIDEGLPMIFSLLSSQKHIFLVYTIQMPSKGPKHHKSIRYNSVLMIVQAESRLQVHF